MLITAPGDIDLEVRAGTRAVEVIAQAGLSRAWCGDVELDADHPAGIPPLVHGARLSAAPARPCLPPTGPYLRVVEGPDAGHVIALGPAVLVGRGDHADLQIDDPAVSAEHAVVTGGTTVRVRDVRSANGTTTSRRRLRPGDHFCVGRTRIELVDPGAAPSTDSSTRPSAFGRDASRRWGVVGGSIASGVALATMTGRWHLGLVGLVPAIVPLLSRVVARRRSRVAVAPSAHAGVIAVRGDPEAVRGYLRARLIEHGHRPPTGEWEEPWMRWLDASPPAERVMTVEPDAPWPSWAGVRVDVRDDGRVEDDGSGPHALPPLAVTEAVADLAARRRASARVDDALPRHLRWGDVATAADEPAASRGPRKLRATIGVAKEGPFVLDLDADGPHVLVAGTTGSGKSVALETLVTALAYAHSPRDLTLALVDFKGGAGLLGCMDLPHVAATLTDLDGALARRALSGLAHELGARKAALRGRGLASLADWEAAGGAPPRLLVVIDEYQEIVASHASFLPDLARLAAQGRSLGLHLVLATQRPAGAVTPEVRANVSTTIALRVASSAESRDLLGTADAATVPASVPGRAIIARGNDHTEVQIAAPGAERSPGVTRAGASPVPGTPLAARAKARWHGHGRATALWLPPLPQHWTPPRVDGGFAFALVDRPAERTQCVATWDPHDGPALIIGPARSGRSSALRALATQAKSAGLTPVVLPSDPRLASRTLALASQRRDVLLLVDDLDALLTSVATVDDGAAVEDLMQRASLRLPTAMAGGPATPMRLAGGASALAVMTGLEPSVAAQWGVPRSLAAHADASPPCRAHVRLRGGWDWAQMAASDTSTAGTLVTTIPTQVHRATVGDAFGVGGDDATLVALPPGPVTVVGPRGPTHQAVVSRLAGAVSSTADVPALVPSGSPSVVVVEPTARAVRQLAPHGWRGVTDPHPVPGRVVLIRDGVAAAVQIPLT